VDQVFGYKLNASAGYGFAVVVDMSPISNRNFDIAPSYLKITTDQGSNYTGDWSGSGYLYTGYANVTDVSAPFYCQTNYCLSTGDSLIGLTGHVKYWVGVYFPKATQEPNLLNIDYDCAAIAIYGPLATVEGNSPCNLDAAANATTTTFPGIRWVTFERDASTGPVIVPASMGYLNGAVSYNYYPDNATLHNVNVFIGTSFNGIASHKDVPAGYYVNLTIPWQYSCGPQFNNVPCGQQGTVTSNISDFVIVKSSSSMSVNGAFSSYMFYVTIEFPNVPYSSYFEGGGAIPITISFS
jgi:hypothetical protein